MKPETFTRKQVEQRLRILGMRIYNAKRQSTRRRLFAEILHLHQLIAEPLPRDVKEAWEEALHSEVR